MPINFRMPGLLQGRQDTHTLTLSPPCLAARRGGRLHDHHESPADSRCSTIELSGRTLPPLRTGPRTNCKRAHGAATMFHGPLQRTVRAQALHISPAVLSDMREL